MLFKSWVVLFIIINHLKHFIIKFVQTLERSIILLCRGRFTHYYLYRQYHLNIFMQRHLYDFFANILMAVTSRANSNMLTLNVGDWFVRVLFKVFRYKHAIPSPRSMPNILIDSIAIHAFLYKTTKILSRLQIIFISILFYTIDLLLLIWNPIKHTIFYFHNPLYIPLHLP